MKIVVIGTRLWPCKADRLVGGGGELVERNHLKLLGAHHEVLWYANSDSEDLGIPGVRTVHLSTPATGPLTKGKRGSVTRTRNKEILLRLRDDSPDFVVSHDDSNAGLCKVIHGAGFPSITHHHAPFNQSGFRSLLGILPIYKKLIADGHTVVTVSEANREEFNSMLLSSGAIFDEVTAGLNQNPEMFFNGILHPYTIWEKPVAKPVAKTRFTILCRPDPMKNAHRAFEAVKGEDVDLVWFTLKPITPSDNEYIEKVLGKSIPENSILWSQPRNEIWDYISESSALIVLGDESFGIAAVEANTLGVPVILGHKVRNHSVLQACGAGLDSGSVVQIDYPNIHEGKKNLREILLGWEEYSNEGRQQILDDTWNRYNPEASLEKLTEIIDTTLIRFEGREKVTNPDSSLSFFEV